MTKTTNTKRLAPVDASLFVINADCKIRYNEVVYSICSANFQFLV